ncbi:MAG TPA: DUF1598 domain-containing protein [Pirellulales bacterium]|nr:DUF1598 domain-containing protein [Pirellulales bacterium]
MQSEPPEADPPKHKRRSFQCSLWSLLVAASMICGSSWLSNPAARADDSSGATTVQLPTFGVAVDADGVLSIKRFEDSDGKLRAERLAAAKSLLPGNLLAPAKLRKVSLVALDRALGKQMRHGQPPDDAMLHLAGLQRLKYVFCFPAQKDIVIAGPAEGWVADPSGRVVGISTGKPVLELADLAVALRTFRPGGHRHVFLGCSIDPNPESLSKLMELQKTVPRSIAQSDRDELAARLAKGQQKALGMADVRVFGVPANSHFAQVLLEADYRMKLIGIGLEEPPVKMTTFLSALTAPPRNGLQRWWFTPNYDCVKVTDDRLAMELLGQGVQLQTEDKVIGPDGSLLDGSGQPNKASELFAQAFTKKFVEISRQAPVYAQMRNLFDLAILAAFIRQQDFYTQSGWQAPFLLDESSLPGSTLPTPRKVQCVVNAVWKGNRLLSPAGGGVSLVPDEALDPKRITKDADGDLGRRRNSLARAPADVWWWD